MSLESILSLLQKDCHVLRSPEFEKWSLFLDFDVSYLFLAHNHTIVAWEEAERGFCFAISIGHYLDKQQSFILFHSSQGIAWKFFNTGNCLQPATRNGSFLDYVLGFPSLDSWEGTGGWGNHCWPQLSLSTPLSSSCGIVTWSVGFPLLGHHQQVNGLTCQWDTHPGAALTYNECKLADNNSQLHTAYLGPF